MPILTRGTIGDGEFRGQYAGLGGAGHVWLGAAQDDGAPIDKSNVFRPKLVAARAERASQTRKTALARTIEREIIPRLMLAHQPVAASTDASDRSARPARLDVAEFAELVLTQDAAIATSYVAALLDRGMTVEATYLDLLSPTARWLGDLWDTDLCYFTDVAIGLTRLHQVMTSIGDLTRSRGAKRGGGRRALLVSTHEEMHHFGLLMVASLFRRADWDVFGWPHMADEDLAALIRTESFHLVGISASCDRHLDHARAAIGLIRKTSRNPAIQIMAGGALFSERPALAAEIGADATARDGLRAVEIANQLVKGAAIACASANA